MKSNHFLGNVALYFSKIDSMASGVSKTLLYGRVPSLYSSLSSTLSSIHPSATLLKLYVGIVCFVLLETSAYTRIEMILKHEHIEHVKCDFSLQSFRMSFFSRIIQQTIIDCTTENVTTIVIKHDTDTTNTCTMSVISSSRSGRHYVFDICWKWFVWNWFCDKIPSSSICIYLSSNNVKPLLGT
mgnify:CR=1 FL=1